jgi:hypothetical protein
LPRTQPVAINWEPVVYSTIAALFITEFLVARQLNTCTSSSQLAICIEEVGWMFFIRLLQEEPVSIHDHSLAPASGAPSSSIEQVADIKFNNCGQLILY